MARSKKKTYRYHLECRGMVRQVIANNKGHACYLAFRADGGFPLQKPRTRDGGWEGVLIECMRPESRGANKRAIVDPVGFSST